MQSNNRWKIQQMCRIAVCCLDVLTGEATAAPTLSRRSFEDAGVKGHSARGDDAAFAKGGCHGMENTSVAEGHTRHPPEVLSDNSVMKTDVKNLPEKQQRKGEGQEQEETGSEESEEEYYDCNEF